MVVSGDAGQARCLRFYACRILSFAHFFVGPKRDRLRINEAFAVAVDHNSGRARCGQLEGLSTAERTFFD